MAERCPACEQAAFIDVGEYWVETREFEVTACCEANLQDWIEDMRGWTRQMWVEWIARKTGLKVRQVITDNVLTWQLDYGHEVRPLEYAEACAFINEHHRHNLAPQGWFFGGGLWNGPELVGVVTAGRPTAPALQKQGAAEITRVCVKATYPSGLTWNGCSTLYGWACRELKRRGYNRIVTFTLLSEPGTSLRAAGFEPCYFVRPESRNRKNNPKTDKAPVCPRVRWERMLDGTRPRIVTQRLRDLLAHEASKQAVLERYAARCREGAEEGVRPLRVPGSGGDPRDLSGGVVPA